jgi:hypothetical protein
MTYEETPIKKRTGKDNHAMTVKLAEQLRTSTLLWLLVKRHKFGIVLAWAIVGTVLFMFPAAPDIVLSLLGK